METLTFTKKSDGWYECEASVDKDNYTLQLYREDTEGNNYLTILAQVDEGIAPAVLEVYGANTDANVLVSVATAKVAKLIVRSKSPVSAGRIAVLDIGEGGGGGTQEPDYLYFEAVDSSVNIGMTRNGSSAPNPVLYYSTDDKKTWTLWTISNSITIQQGKRVYFYGDNYSFASSDSSFCSFTTSGSVKCGGNVQTLLSREGVNTIVPNYAYAKLFYGTSITTAPTMPATLIGNYSYAYMFQNCTSLTTAPPALPATKLNQNCYYYMFAGCTSLTTAPTLSATTLATSCFAYMFHSCTSLTTAPELPATTLASSCYNYMFYSCTSLTTAPALPATSLAQYCYRYMFQNCTSLTTAPTLSATTLQQYCYAYMFAGCTSLTTAPALPATSLAQYCYQHMFDGCTSLTTAPTLSATTLQQYCYQYMFQNCTSLTTAPELPATTLVSGCYSYMFSGCSLLSSVSIPNVTSWNTSSANNWLASVAASGTVHCLYACNIPTGSASGVPSGWSKDYIDGEPYSEAIPVFSARQSGSSVYLSLTVEGGEKIQYKSPYSGTWQNYTSEFSANAAGTWQAKTAHSAGVAEFVVIEVNFYESQPLPQESEHYYEYGLMTNEAIYNCGLQEPMLTYAGATLHVSMEDYHEWGEMIVRTYEPRDLVVNGTEIELTTEDYNIWEADIQIPISATSVALDVYGFSNDGGEPDPEPW